MTANTKFNVGDTVFTMDDKWKIASFEVASVHVYIYKDRQSVYYCSDGSSLVDCISEDKCFASVDELVMHITTPIPRTL